jgi:hypothetical protein
MNCLNRKSMTNVFFPVRECIGEKNRSFACGHNWVYLFQGQTHLWPALLRTPLFTKSALSQSVSSKTKCNFSHTCSLQLGLACTNAFMFVPSHNCSNVLELEYRLHLKHS